MATSAPSEAQMGPPGITMPSLCRRSIPPRRPARPPPGLEKALAFAQDTRARIHAGRRSGAGGGRQGSRPAISPRSSPTTTRRGRPSISERSSPPGPAPVVASRRSIRLRSRRRLQQVIWSGAYVGPSCRRPQPRSSMRRSISPARCWATPRRLHPGTLGGKANVVLLTQDSLQFLAPRFVAMRDSLPTCPA